MVPTAERTFSAPRLYHVGNTFSVYPMGRRDPTTRLGSHTLVQALFSPTGAVQVHVVKDGDTIRVQMWGPGTEGLEPQLEGFLGIHDLPFDFNPKEPRLRNIWKRSIGTYLPRLSTLGAFTTQVILLQLITSKEATRAWKLLVTNTGDVAPGPTGLRLPPSSERLASLPWEQLVAFGVPHKQARTVVSVAKRSSDLEEAGDRGPAALSKFLSSTPGIGPWSDGYICGAGLGDPDAVVAGDYHLPHVAAWCLEGRERGSDQDFLRLLHPYQGHRFRVIRALWSGGQHPPRRGPRRAMRPLPFDR